jgi:hypothetical protein
MRYGGTLRISHFMPFRQACEFGPIRLNWHTEWPPKRGLKTAKGNAIVSVRVRAPLPTQPRLLATKLRSGLTRGRRRTWIEVGVATFESVQRRLDECPRGCSDRDGSGREGERGGRTQRLDRDADRTQTKPNVSGYQIRAQGLSCR